MGTSTVMASMRRRESKAAVNPGQVVVSEDIWRQIRGREGFRFEPFGNRNLALSGRKIDHVGTANEMIVSFAR